MRSVDTDHYRERSQRPLHALIMLLPLIGLYEIGVALIHDNGPREHIRARSMLLEYLMEPFGLAGEYLPGLIIVVVLLTWHIVGRYPWRFDWRLYLAMFAESIALAIPLLMFALVLGRQQAPPAAAVSGIGAHELMLAVGITGDWKAEMVYAIGAGIYEELVFRLMAIALLHFLLVDLIKLDNLSGTLIAIVCSAVLFAAYHFNAVAEVTAFRFTFFTLAGIYLGGIFALRGFGIVVAVHMFYDIFYVLIQYELVPTRA
jgi:membrane protease YdiL (CAAX protease family)